MFERFDDVIFLLFVYLWLLIEGVLGFVVILPLGQAILFLAQGNIERTDFNVVGLEDIVLNVLVGRFFLFFRQIHFQSIHIDADLVIGFAFGHRNHRLHMCCQ